MNQVEIEKSKLSAIAILENIQLTPERVKAMVANVPIMARCSNIEKTASAARYKRYIEKKKNKAPLEDCLKFYAEVIESNCFMHRISTEAGLPEYFLRDKVRHESIIEVDQLEKLKKAFANRSSNVKPLTVRIYEQMKVGKVYQALPLADLLNVDTQQVKNALSDLFCRGKIDRIVKGSYALKQ